MPETFSSVSPIDDSVVWSGNESTTAEVNATTEAAMVAGQLWRQVPVEERIEIVRRYAKHIETNRDSITELITREVGKLPWDAAGEVNAAIAKAELSIQAFQQRRHDHVIDDGPLKRVVRFRPLGVTLVLGPFNFPLHLPGGQIIPALLAGNAVVMKPSEQATAVGQWIADAWREAGLPSEVFQLILGQVAPAVTAIDSPHVNAVFLTGSKAAGQAIHRQLAGRYDVLLALELGGNNPIVITGDQPAAQVASLVSFSAFITAGQRCTCARRAIFVEADQTSKQIDATVAATQALRVGLPSDDPVAQVGPLVSAQAASGLKRTYDRLIDLGCEPIVPFQVDQRRPNLVYPSIVDATSLDTSQLQELGKLEWFGPMLVIQRVPDIETAFAAAHETSYGLAASLLGGDQALFDRFVGVVGAGVVNWNRPTTGAAGALPFGGLGDSGNHRPAGYYAIDFCNEPIASLEADMIQDSDPWSIAK